MLTLNYNSMLRLTFLGLLALAYGAKIHRSPRTAEGFDVFSGEIPWQVALLDNDALFCGGSIISQNHILTTSYCVSGRKINQLTVISGSLAWDSGTVSEVSKVTLHPKYNRTTHENDIAVLELSKPLKYTLNQMAIGLSSEGANYGKTAKMTGWGSYSLENSADRLEYFNTYLHDQSVCNHWYEDLGLFVNEDMICAGVRANHQDDDPGKPGEGFCQFDRGGALTQDDVQVGIASWGFGCYLYFESNYDVYYQVNVFQDFINKATDNQATWT